MQVRSNNINTFKYQNKKNILHCQMFVLEITYKISRNFLEELLNGHIYKVVSRRRSKISRMARDTLLLQFQTDDISD